MGIFEAVGGLAQSLLNKQPSQKSINKKSIDYVRKLAKKDLVWKAQSARDAGLHPLAALGSASSFSGPSVQVGSNSTGGIPDLKPMGQAVDNIIGKYETKAQRAKRQVEEDQNERQREADIDLTKARAKALLNTAGAPPPLDPNPEKIAGPEKTVVIDPVRKTATVPGQPHVEAAERAGRKHVRTDDDTLMLLPSDELKNSIEEMPLEHASYIAGELKKRGKWWLSASSATGVARKYYPDHSDYNPGEGRMWQLIPHMRRWVSVPKGSSIIKMRAGKVTRYPHIKARKYRSREKWTRRNKMRKIIKERR